MKKSILTVPNPILRAKSMGVDLKKDAATIKKHVANLEETLKKKANPKGVGLSAPQIGQNLRIFSTYLPESSNVPDEGRPTDDEKAKAILTTYLNPTIVETSKDRTFGPDPKDPILEGCLSIPTIYGPVPRFSWVRLRFTSPTGKEIDQVYYGFFARVVQHELDHLDGILFVDYIRQLELPLFEFKHKQMVEIDRSILETLG